MLHRFFFISLIMFLSISNIFSDTSENKNISLNFNDNPLEFISKFNLEPNTTIEKAFQIFSIDSTKNFLPIMPEDSVIITATKFIDSINFIMIFIYFDNTKKDVITREFINKNFYTYYDSNKKLCKIRNRKELYDLIKNLKVTSINYMIVNKNYFPGVFDDN